MRGDYRNHPELVDAYQTGELYFAAIALSHGGTERVFELGISAASYSALKRVFQTRPFDMMPGVNNRYFFVPIYSRNPGNSAPCDIRIAQGKDGRGFRFELPKELIANLLWFHEMQSFESAKHLRSWVLGERR
jgi:hypothetical protein